jgi:hypothetical protein
MVKRLAAAPFHGGSTCQRRVGGSLCAAKKRVRATFDGRNQVGKPLINRSKKILAIEYRDCMGSAPTELGKILLSMT